MRTIGVVTVARSDYSYYLPLLRRIQSDPALNLHLMVSGMHLSTEFGMTVNEIEADGFEVAERVEMLLSSDTPEGIAKSIGLGIIGFGAAFARYCPDLLVVLGDRFEMHCAAVASLPFTIPIAHLNGGESTEGLIDEPIRHSITKMSHLHFPSLETYGRRIVRMGEEPWRVLVSGSLSLDNLTAMPLLGRKDLAERFGVDFRDPTLLVTYHPVTLEYQNTEEQLNGLLGALQEIDLPVLLTLPNADTSSRTIVEKLKQFALKSDKTRMVDNLGTQAYFSAMNYAAAMVGNSSSGILEAASFKLPVVNIGNRQRGRLHDRNVIDVGYGQKEILAGIRQALDSEFRPSLDDLVNPYGDGHAADLVLTTLKTTKIDDQLLMKRYHDVEEMTVENSVRRND